MVLSAITIGLMIQSFSQLIKGFDVLSLVILIVSAYVSIVLIYSIATIFYNVDKLSGRQKRILKFLELPSQKEGGRR